jgi:hypothetical protein
LHRPSLVTSRTNRCGGRATPCTLCMEESRGDEGCTHARLHCLILCSVSVSVKNSQKYHYKLEQWGKKPGDSIWGAKNKEVEAFTAAAQKRSSVLYRPTSNTLAVKNTSVEHQRKSKHKRCKVKRYGNISCCTRGSTAGELTATLTPVPSPIPTQNRKQSFPFYPHHSSVH